MEAGPFTKDEAMEIANSISEDYRGRQFCGSDGRQHFIHNVCIAPYRRRVRNELMTLYYEHLNRGCITAHDIRSYNDNCNENEYTVVAVIGIQGHFGTGVNLLPVHEFPTVKGLYYLDILKT